LKQLLQAVTVGIALVSAAAAAGQATAPGGASPSTKPAAPAAPASPQKPLKLQSLGQDTVADPFPPVDPKNFTADSPSASTVDGYLHTVLGYDPNRIWRVAAIQTTQAPGVVRVVVFISEKTPNAKVQPASFFITPDGKHLIADNNVLPFGPDPYAPARAILQSRANGPSLGAKSNALMLVEFSDLQCPHCKDAEPTMKRLEEDFPQAKMVFENLPLASIHPFAEKAALYGVCVEKKGNDAFFTYARAVYDTQGGLTEADAEQTLKAAVTKAGADPATVAACAATPEAKATVDASVKLAADLGISQTPTLMVNGRPVPLGAIPYETLKQLVIFQAGLDGVTLPATPLKLQ
jgi:protein-disulfide isomerase